MTPTVIITVPGVPVPKGRPRFSTAGRFPRAYTPKKTADYESLVRACAAVEMGSRALLEGPLVVNVSAHLPIPQSWSRKKREAAIYPIGKPDSDNFLKAACDSLNGVVYADDSQIVDARVVKLYSDKPHLTITVAPAPVFFAGAAA